LVKSPTHKINREETKERKTIDSIDNGREKSNSADSIDYIEAEPFERSATK
jgi:hypothetical protein